MTEEIKSIETTKEPVMPLDYNKELKELLEKNLALTEEIHEMTHKIKRYISFQKFMSAVYFLIIVVPIILSIIYLPPLLKNIFSQYGNAIGIDGSSLKNLLNAGNPDFQNLLMPKK